MKINLKIDPYHFPIILLLAFAIGFVIAIALGFGPQHAVREMEHQIVALPFLMPCLPGWVGESR